MTNYPFPPNTANTFKSNRNNSKCSNLSLWLDRYRGYPSQWQFSEEQKSQFLQNIAQNFQFDQKLINNYYQRWQLMTQSFPNCQTFSGSPEWRMVVGLGQSSILETSMTLDRITGIPIIPGSALKGLAASYAMLEVLQITKLQEIAETTEKGQEFIKIFGTEKHTGEIIFFDAVPMNKPKLEVDIMNNHYPDYYRDNNNPPTPYQDPVPVYFLTLGKDSKFAFGVASRRGNHQILVELAIEWLQAGLSNLGIGAKTAAGYGYFQNFQ